MCYTCLTETYKFLTATGLRSQVVVTSYLRYTGFMMDVTADMMSMLSCNTEKRRCHGSWNYTQRTVLEDPLMAFLRSERDFKPVPYEFDCFESQDAISFLRWPKRKIRCCTSIAVIWLACFFSNSIYFTPVKAPRTQAIPSNDFIKKTGPQFQFCRANKFIDFDPCRSCIWFFNSVSSSRHFEHKWTEW